MFQLLTCYDRLTIIAFIFIPLSFATSFFGMNFRQFGTSQLNIGWFFLLAGVIGALSYLVAAFLSRPGKLKQYLAGLRLPGGLIWRDGKLIRDRSEEMKDQATIVKE